MPLDTGDIFKMIDARFRDLETRVNKIEVEQARLVVKVGLIVGLLCAGLTIGSDLIKDWLRADVAAIVTTQESDR